MDLTNFIQSALPELLKGKIDIPQGQDANIFGGITDAVMGGFQSSVKEEGGISNIMSLLQGKSSVGSSPVTTAIQNFFMSHIVGKLGLNAGLANSIKGVLPAVVEGIVKKVGEGNIDAASLVASLTGDKGGMIENLKNAAGGLLGGFLKK